MATLRIIQRIDTAANWTSNNPTLSAGEIGYESDTGYWKIGDGSTGWTTLSYDVSMGNDLTVANDLTVENDLQVDGDGVVTGGIEAQDKVFFDEASTGGIKMGDIATGTYGWNDITSEIKVRGTGSTDPNWSVINGTAFSAYEFSVGDKCWMSFHLPHDYAKGTDVYLHVHWLPDGTDTDDVKWEFTYAYAHGHNQAAFDFGSPTTVSVTEDMSGHTTQYQHYVSETAAITISNCEPDGVIEVMIERVTNGGTNNSDDIFVLTADVHYQSTGVPTLNRAPNFYGA